MPHVSLVHWHAWVCYQEQLALAERERRPAQARDEWGAATKVTALSWQIRAAFIRRYGRLVGARGGSAVPPAAEI